MATPQDGINPIPLVIIEGSSDGGDDHGLVEEPLDPEMSEGSKNSEKFAENDEENQKCCNGMRFRSIPEAQGYAWLGATRGALVMSNVFLSTSLIYLASVEADCVNTTNDDIIDDCENRVRGFKPASLIANIAVFSGLLSAFFMPLIGAIIDYTPYRRSTGIISAILIMIIQGVQIGTTQNTWFPMAILQAVAGFFYQVQVLATYAYLPEISKQVGQQIMTKFTSRFYMLQFGSQSLFLIIVIAVSIGFGFDDVATAQVSQAIDTACCCVGFWLGWRLLPNVSTLNDLPEKSNLLVVGFTQTFKTATIIHKNYYCLRWFFLAVIFAEAGANAFTTVSVIFLNEVLEMSGSEIGIIFLIVLVSSLPGSYLSTIITKKVNPNISWMLCLIAFSLATISGAFVLDGPDRKTLAYVWALIWGPIIGWFYSVEIAFYSLACPEGQSAGLSGFYVYCSQILVWLPPLVFTLLYESGIDLQFGLISLVGFFVVAIVFLAFIRWDNVLNEAKKKTQDRIGLGNLGEVSALSGH